MAMERSRRFRKLLITLIMVGGVFGYGVSSFYITHYRLSLTPLQAQHKAKFYLQALTTTFGGASVRAVWTDIGGQWHRDYEVQWLDSPSQVPLFIFSMSTWTAKRELCKKYYANPFCSHFTDSDFLTPMLSCEAIFNHGLLFNVLGFRRGGIKTPFFVLASGHTGGSGHVR